MADGDPIPRDETGEILAQVRDELRKINARAEQADRDRGAGELREPADPAAKRAAKKPAGKSRRRDSEGA